MKKGYISRDGKIFKRLPKNSKGDFAIPDGVEIIAKRAFADCSDVTAISIPSSVREIGEEAFMCCSSLTSIILPEGVDSIPTRTFSDCENLNSVSLPTTIKAIGKAAFEDCLKLTAVVIPEGVETIGGWAFGGCVKLLSIILPSSLKEIKEYAFNDCSSLKSIDIPEGVTVISDSCFSYAGLEEVKLPNSLKEIGDKAFECTNLKAIELGENVERIGSFAFFHLSNDTITLTIGTRVSAIGYGAFKENHLKSITVDKENHTYTDGGCNVIMEIETGAVIYGSVCSSIPENARRINWGAFFDAPKMMSIPGSVETIESYAFTACTGNTFILEEGIKTIKWRAFCGCEQGKITVHLPESVEEIGGQLSSVEFHLDAGNTYFHYDSVGRNIISKDGELVWGRLLQGIPTEGVSKMSAIIDSNIGCAELCVPKNVSFIEHSTLNNSTGIKRFVLTKGTKTLSGFFTFGTINCEIKLLVPIKTSDSGITMNYEYNIPKGTSLWDINNFLGEDSFYDTHR